MEQPRADTDLLRVTEGDLLDELANQIPDTLQDSDVTAQRLMERRAAKGKPISRDTAARFLNQQAELGKLVKIEVISRRGGTTMVYRKPPLPR